MTTNPKNAKNIFLVFVSQILRNIACTLMLHCLEAYGGFKTLNTIDTVQNSIFRNQEIWCNG